MAKTQNDPKEYAAMRACASFLAFFLLCGLGGCGSGGESGTPVGPEGAIANFEWHPVEDPAVTGYRLYWGTAPGKYESSVDVGPNTSHTLTDLVHGTVYYFAVTAYSTAGESSFSDEVSAPVQ
jgi:hypothetical protein